MKRNTRKKLVFIHGWGINSIIWSKILKFFSKNFLIYTIDIPGYKKNFIDASFEELCDLIKKKIPKNAILLAWSLGGLFAIQCINQKKDDFLGCILVCCSPYFIEKENWSGVSEKIFLQFENRVKTNRLQSIEKFLLLNFIKTKNCVHKFKKSKKDFLQKQYIPCKRTLLQGLDIIKNCDLRNSLKNIDIPLLRIYGRLDFLISEKCIKNIDVLVKKSKKKVFFLSGHAPFISEKEQFVSVIEKFSKISFK
ncbi:alpha/beta fold hydrolase [bacterium endosymbiont of Pedicinus badii]|uniref:alpha/beta fold hydrolase n=1 Tax=bacterium endosymbiont of Pedicinus badii TaxID=1719126 RepID=UPI0009BC70EE|nr:alpha/beta fold hydrolase [bacterium endosymbiont of Pedicinus badii]OQM34092.1 hypothetical protein AOQ89_01970 [bacterium endosymbiont of Pedicinus badii]